MKSRSSTVLVRSLQLPSGLRRRWPLAGTLSRLALALLALAGFVAPVAERELDGVVQTSRATRAAPAEEQAVEVQALPAPVASRREPLRWTPFQGNSERRYLRHRAWLL